ncbi:MAG: hypothetical protein ACFFG0_07895 [Candidatus Thorarchaeota archaeon]
MAHVCSEWFPLHMNGINDKRQQAGFYMDDYLKKQLDVYIKNVVNDWDFNLIISGRGEMRVGKSKLAQQIGAYWTYQIDKLYGLKIPFTVKENICLNGADLINMGMKLGQIYKYAALVNDEAADDLESTKVLKASTQAIKDYLRKAAQFNMLNIIVQSEFFEIPKPIAISRSIALIDVSYSIDSEGNFNRGQFKFFSRRNKKRLYLFGKKDLNYEAVKPDFVGSFSNFSPLPEDEYKKAKFESIGKWKTMTSREVRRLEWLKGALKYIYQQGLTHREIADEINRFSKYKIVYSTIGSMLRGESYNEDDED